MADTTNDDGWQRPAEPMHVHFDCFSGAAGDMLLAALLDAAGPQKETLLARIVQRIKSGIPRIEHDFDVTQHRVWRGVGSIAANYVSVASRFDHSPAPVPARASSPNGTDTHGQHDHHAHHHGHDDAHPHNHHRSDGVNAPAHEHDHHEDAHNASRRGPVLRNLPEILQLFDQASTEHIPNWVKRMATATFTCLAAAEAHVHGAASVDDVHFHEVGAIDSIVDTLGVLLALYEWNVTSVSCSALPLGSGTVRTSHGILPVPAPATLYMLRNYEVTAGPPGVTTTGELVTPTAAALLHVLQTECGAMGDNKMRPQLPPDFVLLHTGTGAGTKDFHQHPNITRVLMGKLASSPNDAQKTG